MPVDLSAGQVSTADEMSSATSRVMNWQTDVAGINRVRPGLVSYTTTGLGSAPLVGLHRFKTYVVGVDSDRSIYALPDGSPTVWTALSDGTAATMLDGALRPVFAEDASDLFIVGGGDIQKWTGSGLTARLGAGPQATHIANIGQRLVANDMTSPSRFLFSDSGDGSDGTWQALSFATAEARPDPLVAVYENTAELTLFGQTTTEIWGISSDATNPFQRINALNIGCSAPYSPVRFDNAFVWLDDRRRLVLSDGRSYEVISEAVERDLRNLSTVEDCFGYREDTDRFGCLVFIFPTSERTFTYDYRSKKWGERSLYGSDYIQAAWPVSSYAYWDAENLHLVGASSSGLYRLDTDTRQDIGDTLVAERITGWQDFGTANRKRSAGLRLTMRRGTTPLAQPDGEVEIAVANDGKGFGDFKTVTMGQPADLVSNVPLFFGGVFRKRRYWVRYSSTDDMSLVSLHDDVSDLGG